MTRRLPDDRNQPRHDDVLEALADLTHEQWSGWMTYLFAQSTRHADGSVTVPAWAVERWTRQLQTAYRDLSAEEQASDRAEARRVLALVERLGMRF
jgi:hypothetical protein